VAAELLGILLPVWCLILAGLAWRLLRLRFEREFVTHLIMSLAAPCLIVDSLARLTVPVTEFMTMSAAALALLSGSAACGFALLKLARLPTRSYLPALAFGNAGNMGLPLCLFAFGREGLGLAMTVYIANTVTQFALAPMFQSRAGASKTLTRTPVIYATILGMSLLVADARLPEWVTRTLGLLGGIAIPLMLLALGNALGGLRVRRVGLAAGLGIARLLLGFTVAVAVSAALGLEGVSRGVLILQGSMPTAVFTYLLAARYERDAEQVAGIVLASTVAGACLLPLLLWYLLGASAQPG
jgi:predicted permease